MRLQRGARGSALILLLLAAPASAQECLTADPPPLTVPAQPLRFGITPGAAGTAGVAQADGAPRDEPRLHQALRELRGRRELVLRLNRLFWSDGDAGIARFGKLIRSYAGFRVEVQLRYHPPGGHEGDIAGWEAFVRAAVRRLGRLRAVVGFSITNEANFPVSPNTSDGAYAGVEDALVRGVIAAHAELRGLHRGGLPVGFNVAWRYTPESDAQFWQAVGARATPAFRAALDYVGVQVYPGLVWPPAPLPGRTAGRETVEALTLLRTCYLPMAGLDRTALWVTENGYPTNLGRSEATQVADLASTLHDVHAYSGQLGVTDYRYFNLRDNNSDGTDLFAAVGLLRDDHTAKPSFVVLHDAIAADGGAPLTARRRGRRVRGTVPPPCTGTVRVGERRVPVRADCTYRARVSRRGSVRVRFRGEVRCARAAEREGHRRRACR
ncbi:MAG: hypothetical protein QOI80_784 [Solirubrobacteraceae bacterium]|nr:hypothetical protein [Solirubrobacteraceae bacterium]